MKLAEALILRSDIQKKIASLRHRISNNSLVQEDCEPQEHPHSLMKESFQCMKELRVLVERINDTNAVTKLADGKTLNQAIAKREELGQQHSLLQTAIACSTKEPDRYSRTEIKWVTIMDAAELQKQSDDLSKQIRELNFIIQEKNWNTNLE